MTKSSSPAATLAATLRRQGTSDLRRWHTEGLVRLNAGLSVDRDELHSLTAELDRRALEVA